MAPKQDEIVRARRKEFEEKCTLAGLKPATVSKLFKEDFDSIGTVKLVTDEDIGELELTRGQIRSLQSWRNTLSKGDVSLDTDSEEASASGHQPPPQPNPEDHNVDIHKLSKDKQLNELLAALNTRGGQETSCGVALRRVLETL